MLARSGSAADPRPAWSAAYALARTPVSDVTASVNTPTRRSSSRRPGTDASAGKSGATSASSPAPAARPAAPPVPPTSAPSTSVWASSRARDAPSAARIANSRSRSSARTSIRLATLADAMIRTKITATNSSARGASRLPTSLARSGRTLTPQPLPPG